MINDGNHVLSKQFMRVLSLLLLLGVASACASTGELVQHAFGFDAMQDSSDVYILDYRYGDTKQPTARNPEYLRKEGKSLQRTTIFAEMRRGESLYVKWRVKSSGAVYEDTVDLTRRLPADITEQMVYFIVKGTQLYVYLVPPPESRRPSSKPPNGPAKYSYRDTVTIYPDSKN